MKSAVSSDESRTKVTPSPWAVNLSFVVAEHLSRSLMKLLFSEAPLSSFSKGERLTNVIRFYNVDMLIPERILVGQL